MSIPFKRSKCARLIMMVPAASLVLAGCAEKAVDAQVYSSVSECVAFYNPVEQCEASFGEAQKLHPSVAPRYMSKAECEVDFGQGQCESNIEASASTDQLAGNTSQQSAQSGGSFFMPMMMGFMAAQMMNRAGAAQTQNQPLYKSRDDRNTFRTANNNAVATAPGATKVSPAATQLKPASYVRRGGFGAQAMARSTPNNSYGG